MQFLNLVVGMHQRHGFMGPCANVQGKADEAGDDALQYQQDTAQESSSLRQAVCAAEAMEH